MFDLFSHFPHSERSLLEKSSLLWWIFCQTSWKTLNTTKYTCLVRGIYFKIHAKLKAWLLVFHITSTNSIRNVKAFLKSKMCNFIRMKEDEKQKKYSFHWNMTSFLQTSLVNALVGFLHASVRSKNNFVRLNENRQWKNTSKWITSITQKQNSSEAFSHLSWLLILFSCFFKTINYHIL